MYLLAALKQLNLVCHMQNCVHSVVAQINDYTNAAITHTVYKLKATITYKQQSYMTIIITL